MDDSAFRDRWRERFEEFGASCDDDAGIAGWSTTRLETRLRHFARVWPGDRTDAVWLDVGCGAGTYVRFLEQARMRPIGIDYSAPSLAKARAERRYRLGGRRRDASSDGRWWSGRALCLGVTQALAASDGTVHELARVVRPGGQVWGMPDDVAWAIVYLCSPAGRYVTGETVCVDGGQAHWGMVYPV